MNARQIKLAIIAPVRHPGLMLGEVLMILPAHFEEHEHSKEAVQEFVDAVKYSSKYKILDNGAAEGKVMQQDELIDLAEKLRVDEIIAPDVLYNSQETIKKTKKFMSKCPSKFRVMAVPQGRKASEWIDCLVELQDLGADVIGFSKFSTRVCFREITLRNEIAPNRLAAIRYVLKRNLIQKPIHLLGLRNPHELSKVSTDVVRSCDTCLPIFAAKLQRSMFSLEGVETSEHYFRWKLSRTDVRAALRNIYELRCIADRKCY